MATGYHRVTDLAGICRRIVELGANTAVVDIEPLIAFWDTDQDALQRGMTAFLDRIT